MAETTNTNDDHIDTSAEEMARALATDTDPVVQFCRPPRDLRWLWWVYEFVEAVWHRRVCREPKK